METPVFDPTQRVPFMNLYRASRSPEVRSLLDMTDYSTRVALAVELAHNGAIIDPDIDVNGSGAYDVMYIRLANGQEWFRNILQPMIGYSVGQGDNPPFVPYDPKTVPQGGIKSSIDPKDYPPFDPPTPPAPQPSHKMVGAFNGFIYTAGPDAMVGGVPQVANGQDVVQDGVTYTAVVPPKSPFGWIVYFTKK